MGFEDYWNEPVTKPTDAGFDKYWADTPSTDIGVSARQPQGKPGPLKGKLDLPEIPDIEENTALRSLKDLGNIGSEFLQARMSGKRWANKAAITPLAFTLSKIEGRSMGAVRKELLGEFDKAAERIPKFEVRPANTVVEKAADIATGITKFMAKLAILKKVYPTASGGALWEMENLSSGGTPGMGYTMHGIFAVPGKVIKGAGIGAKVGRVGAESAGLAGFTALETKIDTGEIDWKAVGVSAALPLVLRTPKAIKGLIKAKHPKTLKAVVKVSEESTIKRLKPEELKHYKVLKEGIKDDKVLNFLATKYPKLLELPNKIQFSSSIASSGQFIHDTKTLILNPNYIKTPRKAAEVLVHELIHNYQLKRGTFPKLWDEVINTYGLQGKSNKVIEKRLRSLSIEEYKKLPTEQMAYRLENLIGQKVQSLKAKPVTIETANKEVLSWTKQAKLLNRTTRKVAVKKLRSQQAARGKERYKRERLAGTPRLEAFKKARKAYGGRAAVPEIQPLKLTPEQRDIYGRRIEAVYPESQGFQRTGAADAIGKMESGRIPTNYEFGLLEPILGRDTTKKMYMELIKKRPFSGWELPALIIQGFKTKFGFDIQMFRQARSLAVRHPILYLKSSAVNARAYANNKYAEKVFTEVHNSPGYAQSEKLGWNYVGEAGYSSKRLEYYALGLTERLLTSKNKMLRVWGRGLEASERGAVAGINTMQKGLYDNAYKQVRTLNLAPAQEKAWLKNRAKTHNTFMKILRVPPGKGYQGLRRIKQAANYLLFSPSMTAARPLQIKTLVKDTRYAGEVIALNIASIYAITAIPAIIANQMRLQSPEEEPDVNGELNVLDGQWGKIRWGTNIFDFSGGDAPFYRTLARIGVSSYMYGKEKITGKSITEIAGKRIPDAGATLQRYVETRETAALGYAKTMLTGKDWMGEPIPRLEATVRALSPEVLEATIESGMANGIWETLAVFAATSTSVGVSTYPVRAATTRSKFKDVIARREHDKDWDELSVSEQGRLRGTYRQQFDVLNEKVRKERVDKPGFAQRTKEEEIITGKRVAGMLSKPNQLLVEDIRLGVSRRPKNFYLNDNRYNRYQELIASFIEDKLSKIDFSTVEDRIRVKRVQLIVKAAKNKAFMTVRREARGR